MATTSQPQRRELVEFHTIKLGDKDTRKKLEELFGGLIPSREELCKQAQQQLEVALRPRPFVRPIFRRKRRVPPPNNVPADNFSTVPDDSGRSVLPSNNVPADNSSVVPDDSGSVVASSSVLDSGTPESTLSSQSSTAVAPGTSKPTARKSTTGSHDDEIKRIKNYLRQRCIKIPCQVPLINLKQSDLIEFVQHKLRHYVKETRKKLKLSTKQKQRTESTDSGVASEEEETMVVPPIRIHLSRNEQEIRVENRLEKSSTIPTTLQNDQGIGIEKSIDKPSTSTNLGTSTSYRIKNRKIDGLLNGLSHEKTRSKEDIRLKSSTHSKTGGARKRKQHATIDVVTKLRSSTVEEILEPAEEPKSKSYTEEKISEPAEKLSVKVSIPWPHDTLRIPTNNHSGYLRSNAVENDNDTINTVLPKDVVPATEFDVDKILMFPLACKRYKEPVPLQFFPPCEGQEIVCVSCNHSFPHEKDLARHMLINHHYNF